MTKEDIKKIDIVDFLISSGYEPTKNNENSKYAMFKSPIREDNNASFCVNKETNSWRDRATGAYGDIINLVMELDNCDYKTACQNISNGTFSFHKPIKSKSFNRIVFLRAQPITKKNLFGYACTHRKIDPLLLKKYCKEVYYLNKGQEFYSIGFPTLSGGYELNSQGSPKNFKSNTGQKNISFIPGSGEVQDQVILVEAFFDFLALLTYYKKKESKTDVIVLNSVEMINQAIHLIVDKNYKTVICCLDNDSAGDATLKKLQTLDKNIVDKRSLYRDYKDPNDFLMSIKNP